jgi:MFS family permease
VLGGLASYAVMSFIMTATPLSMHVHDGFSTGDTTTVITAHLLGMYLPSLATPWLVARLGIRGLLFAGIGINVLCVAISAFVGHHFIHYFTALLLLGVGWNFMFVGATALLSATHSAAERYRAQGFNDFAVFGSQAVASLSAGAAIETLGWQTLNLLTLPLLFAVFWALLRVDADVTARP